MSTFVNRNQIINNIGKFRGVLQEKFNVANHYAFLQNSGKGFLYDLKIHTQKTVQIAVSHQGRIYVPGHTVGCLYLLTVIQIPIYRQLHKNQITLYIERHCVQKITGLKFLDLIF